jgi:hypothetical protein
MEARLPQRVVFTITLAILLVPARVDLRAAPPTTRVAERTVREAVKTLTREIQQARNDGGADAAADAEGRAIRSQSNYFTASDAEDIPQAVLLDAMEKPVSRDPRIASYVGWQLLSAVPDGFDEAQAGRAVAIYRDAPNLLPRPGISEADRAQLDEWVKGATRQNAYDLSKQLESWVARNEAINRFPLAYRDEWIRKLPVNQASLTARLEDLFERFQAGVERQVMQEALVSDIEAFARDSRAAKRELESLAETIDRMLAESGPQYYAAAEFRDGQVRWRKQRDSLRRSQKFKALVTRLKDAASQPRGELKFEDE